jgi:ABC-type dipeptide/oligopeptide/nickel transport system permease subunit
MIGVIGGAMFGMFCGGADMVLMYFATNFLYDFAGVPTVLLFWVAWPGIFLLLYFRGAHLERRAQNPLHGLLELSGAVAFSRHPSMIVSRWFWFQEKLIK